MHGDKVRGLRRELRGRREELMGAKVRRLQEEYRQSKSVRYGTAAGVAGTGGGRGAVGEG